MSERFYLNLPLALGPIELTGPEAHHLANVCRLRPGDAVQLFNGDGREYPALIRSVTRKAVQLDIRDVEEPQRELPFTIEVAAPLPKGDRAQFLIEKLTELGVTAFVPLSSARSVVHPRETKLDKLHRYVTEASKQCGRNRLMEIRDLVDWATYCHADPPANLRLLGHPGGRDRPDATGTGATASVHVAVGPEGGFTDDEVAQAREAGWQLIDLGPRVLRIETAALVLAVQAIGMPRHRRPCS
jgi:16S rRNA (uracil1498-N3)-methyltransferase